MPVLIYAAEFPHGTTRQYANALAPIAWQLAVARRYCIDELKIKSEDWEEFVDPTLQWCSRHVFQRPVGRRMSVEMDGATIVIAQTRAICRHGKDLFRQASLDNWAQLLETYAARLHLAGLGDVTDRIATLKVNVDFTRNPNK